MAKLLKSWFAIDGSPGDRTLAQQLKGLDNLIERVAGKTVLDVGCAEGLISIYLVDHGAIAVHGIEVRPDFVEVANRLRGDRACTFEVAYADDYQPVRQYDIVLLLAVLHKLVDPTAAAKRFAAAAREMVVVRSPPTNPVTVIDGQHHIGRAITESGFMLCYAGFTGPKGEWVGLWERIK